LQKHGAFYGDETPDFEELMPAGGHVKRAFQTAAQTVSRATGSAWAFIAAFSVVLAWAVTGPMFNFSDTWQLVINTGTTIVTFLMVFLIQNTQNRDTVALHAKLDELIIKLDGADNALVTAEEMSDEELAELMQREKAIAANTPSSGPALKQKAEAEHVVGHAAEELERRGKGSAPEMAAVSTNKHAHGK
jgi:low affinity Fe/Cu permease